MRYQVIEAFKVKTSQGEMELQPGQVIILPKDKAIKLLNEGKIKAFCYWLNDLVDDCNMPCFEIDVMTVIHECPHFKAFWDKRLKQLRRENEQFKT